MDSKHSASSGCQLELGLPAMPLNDVVWSEDEIYQLLDRFLVDQLRLLNDDRTSATLREEIIEWVAAPIVGREEAHAHPFCFQACCDVYGADAEEMQERILRIVARQRLMPTDK